MNRCSCTREQIDRYRKKISQAILERIDLCVEVSAVSWEDVCLSGTGEKESVKMKEQVQRAHNIQKERYRGTNIQFNGQLGSREIPKYCRLSREAEKLTKEAFSRMRLSLRVCHRIIKVSRTLADLEDASDIGEKHILEALYFRGMDQEDWKA
jgi:magnesium chelatase family protein